jgi:hypothetical protein
MSKIHFFFYLKILLSGSNLINLFIYETCDEENTINLILN